MNERIRELLDKSATFDTVAWYIDPEKFAESIIRECIELAADSRYENTRSEYYEGFNEALIYMGIKIRKHFGIENGL